MKIFMFMYILADDLATVQASLGRHVSYWKELKFDYFRNGPFADKSGGMILFSSTSLDDAQKIVSQDPLLQNKAIRDYLLKEWIA